MGSIKVHILDFENYGHRYSNHTELGYNRDIMYNSFDESLWKTYSLKAYITDCFENNHAKYAHRTRELLNP